MNLGFYYHTQIHSGVKGLSLPSYLGLFIDGLASRVEKFYLIAHTHKTEGDYSLQSKNIILIDLGAKTNSIDRSFLSNRILLAINPFILDIDILLVRAPSPLAPAFHSYSKLGVSIIYYLVGDYAETAKLVKGTSMRKLLQRFYLIWCHQKLMKAIRGKKVLVNSPALMSNVRHIASSVNLIPSTTLREENFYLPAKRSEQKLIKILYTGRLDLNKGLIEMVEALSVLVRKYTIELHLVGWEDDTRKPVEFVLKDRIESLGLHNSVCFHGKKKVGKELNAMYRMADIYCIPSYHEGFPRTIWEAMANGLPVIATKVGGIPYFLEHEMDSILIEPKSVDAIVGAIEKLLKNDNLRHTLSKNGWQKAKMNTVDKRSDELIKYINEVF